MTRKALPKLLFFAFSILLAKGVFATVFEQEQTRTHLRWNFFIPKDTLVLEKKNTKVFLKTLNSNFYKEFEKILHKLNLNSRYIKGFESLPPSQDEHNVSTIIVELSDPSVEIFGFYRDREEKYVLDFWKDNKKLEFQKTGNIKEGAKEKISKLYKKPHQELKEKKKENLKQSSPARAPAQIVSQEPKKEKGKPKSMFRDYRYGATFVWDYPELKPKLEKIVDISRKTVEYFYPIKDRDFKKNKKEAHNQLTINLYRKKKYGLMYKSIKLYREQYDEYSELNEYLKANAILRDNIKTGNAESLKMAINILINIEKGTNNYELKKAIMKYLIQYYMDNKESIEALKVAKRSYVASKGKF